MEAEPLIDSDTDVPVLFNTDLEESTSEQQTVSGLALDCEEVEQLESDVSCSEGEPSSFASESDFGGEGESDDEFHPQKLPSRSTYHSKRADARPTAAPAVRSDGAPEEKKTVLPKVFVARDGTKWHRLPPGKAHEQRVKFKSPESKFPGTDNVVDPTAAFLLFLTPEMRSSIAEFTNTEGRRSLGDAWKDTDEIEILALIGCLLLAGAMRNTASSTSLLWHKMYGVKMLQASFSHSRFAQLNNYLRFDEKASGNERSETDPFAPIRALWEVFNQNLIRHYVPGPSLVIGEQLVPWRGRCPFLQCVPTKHEKYGILFSWICDVETGYPLKGVPCVKKSGYKAVTPLERSLAMELTEPYHDTGRQVAVNNSFLDLSIADCLLINGLSVIGMVHQNAPFLPKEFANKKYVCTKETLFGFQRQATLMTHNPGQVRNKILLSSEHSDSAINERDGKPEMLVAFNKTKCIVDSMAQAVHSISPKHKTQRWPLLVFFNMLGVASAAAHVIYREKFPQDAKSKAATRTLFQIALAEGLLCQQIERRLTQTNLSKDLRLTSQECVRYLEGSEPPPPTTATSGPSGCSRKRSAPILQVKTTKRRCSLCSWRLGRKTPYQCNNCGKFVCHEHMYKVCSSCVNITSLCCSDYPE
ncbi:PiggyBac transposable element-derived protein 4 [Plakobranchus ocellatus]|uniref:PiggyBac transposable element-derived protein 4 n=1 Tax=Plakobranchus ocellatus TaxID=259542 RepID=A0AAV3Z5B1_9GAST|nr:PiggyBac transposable element-derived protein 4 [Plakobranchus ocellatus]